MTTNTFYGPTDGSPPAPAVGGGLLKIETIEAVVPLDDQFGAKDVRAVPEALQPWLFGPDGDDGPAPDDTAQAPLVTYAILDAARIKNLAETLATTDLPHRCLFNGAAFDDLGAVAPWIVVLTPEHRFTRNLFTRGDATWQLWDDAPGIFVRTRAPLEEVRAHFRKFTKVRNEAGDWLYWRFWEAGGLARLMTAWQGDADKIAHFAFVSSTAEPLTLLCPDAKAATFCKLEPQASRRGALPNGPFVMTQADRAVLSAWRAEAFDAQLLAGLKTSYPVLDKADAGEVTNWLNSVIEAAQRSGIRLEEAIHNFAHAAYLLGADPAEHGETRHIMRDRTLHQKDRARLARGAAERYSKIRR